MTSALNLSNTTTLRVAASSATQVSVSSSSICNRQLRFVELRQCGQYSGDRLPERERSTDTLCGNARNRLNPLKSNRKGWTKMPVPARALTDNASHSAIWRGSHGRQRRNLTSRTSRALIHARAAAGLRVTANHPPKRLASCLPKSCVGFISGSDER